MSLKKIVIIFLSLILLVFGYKFYMHYRIVSSILNDAFVDNGQTFEILKETIFGKDSEVKRVKLVKQTIGDTVGFEVVNKIEINGVSTMLPFSKSVIQSIKTTEQLIDIKTNNGKRFRILYPFVDHTSLNLYEPHKDAFEFFKSTYSYDAGHIGFFQSNEKLLSEYTLFISKKMFLPNGAVHYLGVFERGDLRGFQACHPDRRECAEKLVAVEIFLKNNKTSIMFFENFTQDEIDFVLSHFTTG